MPSIRGDRRYIYDDDYDYILNERRIIRDDEYDDYDYDYDYDYDEYSDIENDAYYDYIEDVDESYDYYENYIVDEEKIDYFGDVNSRNEGKFDANSKSNTKSSAKTNNKTALKAKKPIKKAKKKKTKVEKEERPSTIVGRDALHFTTFLVIFFLIFVVVQNMSLSYGRELKILEKQISEINELNTRITIEIAEKSKLERVEKIAIEQLGMVYPNQNQVEIVPGTTVAEIIDEESEEGSKEKTHLKGKISGLCSRVSNAIVQKLRLWIENY